MALVESNLIVLSLSVHNSDRTCRQLLDSRLVSWRLRQCRAGFPRTARLERDSELWASLHVLSPFPAAPCVPRHSWGTCSSPEILLAMTISLEWSSQPQAILELQV